MNVVSCNCRTRESEQAKTSQTWRRTNHERSRNPTAFLRNNKFKLHLQPKQLRWGRMERWQKPISFICSTFIYYHFSPFELLLLLLCTLIYLFAHWFIIDLFLYTFVSVNHLVIYFYPLILIIIIISLCVYIFQLLLFFSSSLPIIIHVYVCLFQL